MNTSDEVIGLVSVSPSDVLICSHSLIVIHRQKWHRKYLLVTAAVLICSLIVVLCGGCGTAPDSSDSDNLLVGLILKTDDNPFFLTIEQEARQRATELGVELRTVAGEYDGDSKSQIEAIDRLLNDGAAGILITPSDPDALVEVVKHARRAGVMVVALDSPFNPVDLADATFATDNFKAGELIGMWAAAHTDIAKNGFRIAMLNGNPAQDPVDVLRNQGFLNGFGIDIKDPNKMHDETDSRVVGSDTTMGSETGGRSAMERLLRQNPTINLVYAINEPAATGAVAALEDLGLAEDVLIVTIDGACSGVRNVAEGRLGATVIQYPSRMARLGIEAVIDYVRTGKRPVPTPGLDFQNTGVTLFTNKPIQGIPSISTERALEECWE